MRHWFRDFDFGTLDFRKNGFEIFLPRHGFIIAYINRWLNIFSSSLSIAGLHRMPIPAVLASVISIY